MSQSRKLASSPVRSHASPVPVSTALVQHSAARASAPVAAHWLGAVPATRPAPAVSHGTPVAQLNGKTKAVKQGKVGSAEREMARAGRAGTGQAFSNTEGLLPKAAKGQHYEEIQPAAPTAAGGMGERRVVILKDSKGNAIKQYATYTHYGTGDSAQKNKADFIEF